MTVNAWVNACDEVAAELAGLCESAAASAARMDPGDLAALAAALCLK